MVLGAIYLASAFVGGWAYIPIGLVFLVPGLAILLYDKGKTKEQKNDNALEILKNRYAKGELTSEEFERMKKDLNYS